MFLVNEEGFIEGYYIVKNKVYIGLLILRVLFYKEGRLVRAYYININEGTYDFYKYDFNITTKSCVS